jgi:hypothetical protein
MAVTKAEETYTALGAKLKRGMRLSEAVRELARETGRSEAAIRANYYNQRKKLGEGDGRRGRRRSGIIVEEVVREARQLLERALAQIDDELATAEAEVRATKEHYERMKVDATEHKAELKRKLAALRGTNHDARKEN